MPIVFNAYALLQAIIAVLCLGVLQLGAMIFAPEYNLIGGTNESVFSLQFMALVAAFTDARGMKGRLFFLPTWLVLVLGSLFVFHFSVAYYLDQVVVKTIVLYCSSAFIAIFYFVQTRLYLEKTWAKKKGALEVMKSRISQGDLTPKEYWQIASHAYYRPPALFFNSPLIWKFFFKNAIDGDDFLEHYKYFINSINTAELLNDEQRQVIREIKDALAPAQNFDSYNHPEYSLGQLGRIIDGMNEKFKE